MAFSPRGTRGLKQVADNYPEAAGKHARDCQVLLSASRFDGAGYLAGYAVECVLKTLIRSEGAVPRLHHHLDRLSQEAIRLAGLPSQKTMKYVTHPNVTTLTYGPRQVGTRRCGTRHQELWQKQRRVRGLVKLSGSTEK